MLENESDLTMMTQTAALHKFVQMNLMEAPTHAYAQKMLAYLNNCLNDPAIQKSYPEGVLNLADASFLPHGQQYHPEERATSYIAFWDKLLMVVVYAHDNVAFQRVVAKLN